MLFKPEDLINLTDLSGHAPRVPKGQETFHIKAKFNDYKAFIEKFKDKNAPKTTDECYTPKCVYDAVVEWVLESYPETKDMIIERPFYPNGDYENYPYTTHSLVLDNPPFSKITQIRKFYERYNIKYFLFAPLLTLFNIKAQGYVLNSQKIHYTNGAKVATSFITNLHSDIVLSTELSKRIKDAHDPNELKKNNKRKQNPPKDILNGARMHTYLSKAVRTNCPDIILSEWASATRNLLNKDGKNIRVFGGAVAISQNELDKLDKLEDEVLDYTPEQRAILDQLNKKTK